MRKPLIRVLSLGLVAFAVGCGDDGPAGPGGGGGPRL
jgi:hypothetical protein